MGQHVRCEVQNSHVTVPEHVRPALRLLLRAHDLAAEVRCSPWDFAVEIDSLTNGNVDRTDLRWLLKTGFLSHARENTECGAKNRNFIEKGAMAFSRSSCFVLTDDGAAAARKLTDRQRITSAVHPDWDGMRHQLWLGSTLIKEFKLPSPNQESILTAFQEEGWPPKIDDPLPQHPDINPKRRLNDTIKGLNRHQKAPVIRFAGDGTGEAVLWEPS